MSAQLAIPFVQRWRDRRHTFRPAGELIDTSKFEVARIDADGPARAFVTRHHYSASYPAARFRFGLYRGPQLVGVAIFSVPTHARTIEKVFPIPWRDGVDLGRFVLLDDVPANGETWFLGRCFRALRQDVAAIVSFSDPVPRTTSAGRTVFPGHVGTIYQAHNGVFLGRGARGTLRLLADGRVLANRAISKIRTRERGWRYSAELLEREGAAPLGEHDDARAWLHRWLPRLTRIVTHPGNLKYAWPLDRALVKGLPASLPYPKADDPRTFRL